MKKFTKLWQLMFVLMLTSSMVFAQRQTSATFGENQKDAKAPISLKELSGPQIQALESQGLLEGINEEGLSQKAMQFLNKMNLGPAPGGNAFKPTSGGPTKGNNAWAINLQAPNEFAVFDADAPSTVWTPIASPAAWASYGGDYGNDSKNYYYVIDNTDEYLKIIDVANGNIAKVIGKPDFGAGSFTGMACDRATGIMYAEVWNGTDSDLYTLDLTNGAATLIGNSGVASDLIIDIAIDGTGTIYGWGLNDIAYTIDKATGATTAIGPLGVDLNYAQGGTWDPVADIIYLCAYNVTTSTAEMYTLDKVTGALTLIDALPGETDAMGFPSPLAPVTANDVMVSSVDAPLSGSGLTATETVTVTIYNAGTASQSNIPVSYSFNGGAAVNEVFAGPLAANSSASFSFAATVDASAIGTYTLLACTNLVGDEIPANDCVDYAFENIAPPDCDWSITGSDAYGDGWNGGSIDIVQDGAVTFSWAGPATTGPETVFFGVYEGAVLDIVWNPGAWDSEVTYEVFDNFSVSVWADGPNPTGTTGITATCLPPSCPPPANFFSSNPTIVGIDANWDEMGTATTWNLEWGLPGFAVGTGAEIGAATHNDPFGANPRSYTITGLSSCSAYEWYVQADCGGSQSAWMGPVSFSTTGSALSTFPFTETFDAFGNSIPAFSCTADGSVPLQSCWTNFVGEDIDWDVISGATGSGSTGPTDDVTGGGQYLYTETSSCYGMTGTVISPEFDFTTLADPLLTFSYSMYGADMGTMSVDVSIDGGTTWTNVWTLSGDQGAAWVMQDVSLTAYAGATSVMFRWVGLTGAGFQSDMAFDQVEIKEAPTCPDPTALGTANPTATGLDLVWTSNSGLSNVEYGVTGFVQGTGTMLTGVTSPQTIAIAAGDYDFYVQDDCGGGDLSNWVGPFAFTYIVPPTNNDCNTPDVVSSFPTTLTGTTAGATVTCTAILPADNGNVWYEIQIPAGTHTLTVDMTGTAFDNIWIVASTVQCSCDLNDYIFADDWNFTAAGTMTDLAFENIVGPTTLWLPVQTGTVAEAFDITFNLYNGPVMTVAPASLAKGVVENGNATDHLMVGNAGDWNLTFDASVVYPTVGTSVFFDDFETGLGAWTVVDNGGTCVWDLDSNLGTPRGNLTNGSGDCATADSDRCGSGSTMDTELHSPVFDLTGYTYAQLTFEASYNDISTGGTDLATVDISIDGGATWNNLLTWDEDHNPESVIVDLTPYAGNANCMLNFGYLAPGWDWWFQIDDVNVKGANSPFPPTGWLTVDGGASMAGSVLVGDPAADVLVGFDATGIAPGTYNADILVSSNDPVTPTVTVPVQMVVVSGVIVDVKVFLEGPYDIGTGSVMFDDLNTGSFIPMTQPYNPALPYYGNPTPVWLYGGTQTVTAVPAGAVDWVVIQVRDAVDAASAGSGTIAGTTVAFLMTDGSVVGLDGVSRVGVPTAAIANNVFLVVYHRNHLGVMSSGAVPMVGSMYTWDFTTAVTQAYNSGHKDLGDGNFGMVAADGDGNGLIQSTDEQLVWKIESGLSGYLGGDFTMNGLVQSDDENNYWKVNSGAGGQVPAKSESGGYQSQIPK
ncbi:MAG: hypothetical protein GXO89_02615 [Chlorobi bacterium]|nr:hypothetical protein [Chlorobiota bacterium]